MILAKEEFISMFNWKNLDLEFDEHAFKHGIKDYEIEQIFEGRIYKNMMTKRNEYYETQEIRSKIDQSREEITGEIHSLRDDFWIK